MYFLSLKLFEVLKFIQFLMLFENQFLDTSSNFERCLTDRWLPSPIYFYLFLLVIYFLIFQLPYQQLPLELADKVIEKSKKKYIEWHFCHHMYFLSLMLFEVLKFIQFLMLFENQFLDTSSNFERQKKQIDDCLHRSIFIYFCWLFIFWFFQLPYQQLPLELADKVIENQKEVHRMTFLSPYVLPVAQVVWGVEIHSIPHVIWKSISWHLIQFWAPKNRSMIAFTDLFLFIFAGYLFFDFSITLSATSFGAGW